MHYIPIKIHVFVRISIAAIAIFLCACSEQNEEFTIGKDFIESQTRVLVVDTFSVELSTVIMDPLPSSGTGILLLGNYQDSIFGKVTCNGYFQVGLPDNRPNENTDFYDSISVILHYTKYSYGDTTQNQVLSVHRLRELIQTDESGYLYNSSKIDYDPNPIGSISVIPRPESVDSIEIRLSDALGEELFQAMMENREFISTQGNFLNYFNGIAIIADDSQNGSITGFKANEGVAMIRLYTHRIRETVVEVNYDFPLYDIKKQFNQIHYEFENTALNAIKRQSEAVSSGITGDKAFVQGGTGLMAKLRFPFLNEIFMFEQGIVIMAELILKPEKGSYNVFSLPEELYLYETDKINRLGNVLYNGEGNIVVPQFILDNLYNDNTTYTFDITNFLTRELTDNYYDTEHGLLLTLTSDNFLSSFKRLIIDTKNPKLKIYYLTY